MQPRQRAVRRNQQGRNAMKKLVLHVGTPKTGTTAIQKFLMNNAAALEERGIYYPVFPSRWPGVEIARNGHFIFQDVMARLDHPTFNTRPNLLPPCTEKFAQLVANLDGTMILSDETFWQMASRFEDTLPTLKNICDGLGFDSYQIIVYLRRQDVLVESWYAQRVKGVKVTSITFDKYLKSKATHQVCTYNKVIKRFEEVFGQQNVHIGIYDRKLLKAGDSAADFMDVIGLDIEDPAFDRGVEEENDSIRSNNFLELKRMANTSDAYRAGSNFLKMVSVSASNNFPEAEKTSLFTPEQRKEYMAQYEKGNRELARRYFGRDDLFGPQKADDLPAWQPNQEQMNHDAFMFLIEALTAEHKRTTELSKRIKQLEARLDDQQ